MSKPITVIAHIAARPGMEAETLQVLQHLVQPTREEPGCIAYELFVRPDAPGRYMFIETWESRTHLDSHLRQPHVQALISRSGELLAGPLDVSLWEQVAQG